MGFAANEEVSPGLIANPEPGALILFGTGLFGLAYLFRRNNDEVETIIYQPSRAEVRRLAVNAECVF